MDDHSQALDLGQIDCQEYLYKLIISLIKISKHA